MNIIITLALIAQTVLATAWAIDTYAKPKSTRHYKELVNQMKEVK
jgi:hypothetical protein